MTTYKNNIAMFLMPVLSGILMYSSFPPLDMPLFVWIALIPLFISLRSAGCLKGFFLSFLTGVVFSGSHALWLNVIPDLKAPAFLLIITYGSIYFGLFGLFYCLVLRRTALPAVLIASIIWAAIEYVRSNLSFLAVPWALLGHTQHSNIEMMQIASFTSVYGISFLIVLLNSAVTEGLLYIKEKYTGKDTQQIKYKTALYSLICSLTILLLVYAWGHYQIRENGKNNKTLLTASLIQGNIPQEEKWDRKFRKKIMARYKELTEEASKEHPDIIIWPEAATPGYLKYDFEVYNFVRDLVRKTGTTLLTGSSSYAKIGGREQRSYKFINSAFLMDGNGKILSYYHKKRLMPFGEYLPLEGKFPWPRWLVPDHGRSLPGTESTVFQVPEGKFGVVICWENLFSDTFREFVKRGSQFMVNITNEAWFKKTEVSSLLMTISVFRAVENRVALLRCANTGITSFIDPLGRVRAKVTDKEGNDLMVTGALTISVPEPGTRTFYTKYGDIFALLCVITSVIFIITAMIPVNTQQFSNKW